MAALGRGDLDVLQSRLHDHPGARDLLPGDRDAQPGVGRAPAAQRRPGCRAAAPRTSSALNRATSRGDLAALRPVEAVACRPPPRPGCASSLPLPSTLRAGAQHAPGGRRSSMSSSSSSRGQGHGAHLQEAELLRSVPRRGEVDRELDLHRRCSCPSGPAARSELDDLGEGEEAVLEDGGEAHQADPRPGDAVVDGVVLRTSRWRRPAPACRRASATSRGKRRSQMPASSLAVLQLQGENSRCEIWPACLVDGGEVDRWLRVAGERRTRPPRPRRPCGPGPGPRPRCRPRRRAGRRVEVVRAGHPGEVGVEAVVPCWRPPPSG